MNLPILDKPRACQKADSLASLPWRRPGKAHAARCDDRRRMRMRGWEQADVVFCHGRCVHRSSQFRQWPFSGACCEAAGFRGDRSVSPGLAELRGLAAFRRRDCLRDQRRHMDSMINHYTANRKSQQRRLFTRRADWIRPIGRRGAILPAGAEAYKGVPVIAGGVEARCEDWHITTTGATKCVVRSCSMQGRFAGLWHGRGFDRRDRAATGCARETSARSAQYARSRVCNGGL